MVSSHLITAFSILSCVCLGSLAQLQIPRQNRLSVAERQQRKKCNREIQFCTRQNIDVFGLFVQTVLSIDVKRVNNEEAHRITENLCLTFRPIFDCIDRRNASTCSVPVGQQSSSNKLFHISYFVLVCELAKIWRECSVVGSSIETGAQSNKITSVCSDHFPALHREAEQLRLLNNPSGNSSPLSKQSVAIASPELSMMADQQPILAPSTLSSMEFILLNITESHCEDIMMFTGCQLHWTRSICGNKAYAIVKRLFAAYNDMSGKKCSGNHELQDVDFEVLERKYAERYLFLSGMLSSPSNSANDESTSPTVFSIISSPVIGKDLQVTRDASDMKQLVDGGDGREEMFRDENSETQKRLNFQSTKTQIEYNSESPASGPLNSAAIFTTTTNVLLLILSSVYSIFQSTVASNL